MQVVFFNHHKCIQLVRYQARFWISAKLLVFTPAKLQLSVLGCSSSSKTGVKNNVFFWKKFRSELKNRFENFGDVEQKFS